MCGVPKENEAESFDVLLGFLKNIQVSATVKLRSVKVLEVLVIQYPDLKPEFVLTLYEIRESSRGSLLKRVNINLEQE